MSELSRDQKELLFDDCIGLTRPEQAAKVKALISFDGEAARLYACIKAALAPLDSLAPEPCPDDLVERTLLRLKDQANPGPQRLQQLLAVEQARDLTAERWNWANLTRGLATAAVVLFSVSVFLPSLGYLRHHSRAQRCQMYQNQFFQGLSSFVADHDGQAPSVAAAAGSPWWKIGHPGFENHSNTRKIFRLVADDYVQARHLVCPGSRRGRPMRADPAQIRTYRDFPNRDCVTYSFQINCRQVGNGQLHCQGIVMADRNPLFENLPRDFSQGFRLQVDERLLALNSGNHSFFGRRRGQNVLHGTGNVEFLRMRFAKDSTDDIFTVQGTDVYHGSEVPACENDVFLAP